MPPEPPAGTIGSFNIAVDNVSINFYNVCDSGVATPGPTRAQALVEFICAPVKLLNSQA